MRTETSSAAAEPPSCSPPPAVNLTAGCAKAAPAPLSCGRTARSSKPAATSRPSAMRCRRSPEFMAAQSKSKADVNDRAAGAQRRQRRDAGGFTGREAGAHPDQRARRDADIIVVDPAPGPRVLDEQGHPIPPSAQLETRVV